MYIYKEFLKGEISFDELLEQSASSGTWILPDGEQVVTEGLTHTEYVFDNPEEFGLQDVDTLETAIPQALDNGAIRFTAGSGLSNRPNIEFSNPTKAAIREMRKIIKGFEDFVSTVFVEQSGVQFADVPIERIRGVRDKKDLIELIERNA